MIWRSEPVWVERERWIVWGRGRLLYSW